MNSEHEVASLLGGLGAKILGVEEQAEALWLCFVQGPIMGLHIPVRGIVEQRSFAGS